MKLRWKVPLVTLVVIIMWVSIGIAHKNIMYSENYNCVYMSRDLERFVEVFGIPVTLMRGQNNDGGHLWVKIGFIEFDSVCLLPFPNHIFYPEVQMEFDDWEDYCKIMRVEP